MRYVLRLAVLDFSPEIEISDEEFLSLVEAREILVHALGVEETYEILVTNYLEFEKQLLHVAVTNSVRDTLDYAEVFETRSVLNVCLVNLLTAARLYLDQLNPNVRDCLPNDPSVPDVLKCLASTEYDAHFEYRFMEQFRNHVQHRGIPIHFMGGDSKWTSYGEDGRMEFSVYVSAQRKLLEEDKTFKKTVLDEITEDVDLVAASRRYVESLSSIHQSVRELIDESVKKAREKIQEMHSRYATAYDGKLTSLAAFEVGDEDERSSVPLLLEWDDVRVKLNRRNRQLINLRKRYVTGRTRKDCGK